MAISPQQLTIYLYSAHRAVISAIAQLSCWYSCSFGVTWPSHFRHLGIYSSLEWVVWSTSCLIIVLQGFQGRLGGSTKSKMAAMTWH